jgi:16S rRNA (uracil1498-N3)-methyltransferase
VNLLLLEADQLRGTRAVLSTIQARHARDVLRVVPGQDLRVGMLDGPRGVGRVVRIDDSLELECAFEPHLPPVPDIDVLLALPRPKVMRRLWAQLAALGVGHIILTNAARVERNYFDTHVLEPALYRPLLVEGLQQAQDTRLPRVSIHRRFRPLVEDELDALSPSDLRFAAHPSTDAGRRACAARGRPRRRLG